ncbi:MAG: radical SAM protein [Candidatus Omnitrophota bacterium]|nr:radical SAM protein [Candidatus Omnitrophota bacterium]
MEKKNFKYIYGPVPSWRLGSSLGVDLLSRQKKICNFDCIYCQLGATERYTTKREVYVPAKEVIREIRSLPFVPIDYITFSGRGEPGLAANLTEVIKEIRLIRSEPLAILTNSCLMGNRDFRKELLPIDFVCLKMDACSQASLREINRPAKNVEFKDILRGIRQFRKEYTGKLALQIMFVEQNKSLAKELSRFAKEVKPDEIQINTPLRLSAVRPLTRKELFDIKGYFKGLNTVSVYDKKHKQVLSISTKDTLKRRGKQV